MPEKLTNQDRPSVYRMYLSKEKLDDVSREDLQVFLHILRMTNSLRSIMKLHLKLNAGKDRLEAFKDGMEIYLLNIATYYEAFKTLVRSLMPRINKDHISRTNLAVLNKLKERFESKQRDPFLRVAAATRNKIVFHFDSEIVDNFVKDGSPSADLLIGYARSKTVYDSVYLEPSTAIFAYLSKLCPDTIAARDSVDWIQTTSIKEIGEFCVILERIAGAFFKRNGKLVEGPPLLG